MNEDKKSKIIGIIITLLLHILMGVVLWLNYFGTTPHEEESGILVMVGVDAEGNGGELMESEETELQPEPSPDDVPPTPPAQATPQPSATTPEPILTQDDAEAPYAAEQKEKELKERKAEEAKLLAQAEAKRQEEIRRQQEEEAKRKAEEEAARKKAEEVAAKSKAISNQVAGLFNNNGTGSSEGLQGAASGISTTGAASGSPGYGSFDLGGRGMVGSLPRPEFNKNISGTMVVAIWVDSEGNVKEAHAGAKGSNISDTQIRIASEKAAKQAKFAKTDNKGLTQGTITYHFDSNN